MTRSIRESGLGGVILFDRDILTGGRRNIASPEQLVELTAALREAAGDRPLLIAVDQEGGRVARLGPDDGFPATPSQAEVGLGTTAEARAVGRRTAATLASVGINLNLAPVVDLNVNPDNPSIGALDRSFGADADLVVRMATAVIRGHHDEGVVTAIKHFPGLGSATGDTDREFVDISGTWRRPELEPFRRLVAAGLPDAVMVANAVNRRLDPELPATLSRATIDLLRSDIGWTGPVVTDDLQAGALRSRFDDRDVVRLSLAAGNDLLLFANQQVYVADLSERTIDLIVDLVEGGRIPEGRIDEAAARVALLAGPAA